MQVLVGVAVAVLTGVVSGQFRLAASVAWGCCRWWFLVACLQGLWPGRCA